MDDTKEPNESLKPDDTPNPIPKAHSKNPFEKPPIQKDTEKKRLYRQIARLTGPAFVELFLSATFSSVDSAMVGRLGKAEFAGVGLTSQPFFLLMAVFSTINVGVTTMVSWAYGKQRSEEVSAILKQAILFNVIAGLLLSVVGYIASPYIIGFIGAGEADNQMMIHHGIVYMKILSLGIFFQAINMGITAALRGAGETKIPMAYNLLANGINVVLNWMFIYGNLGAPKLGVFGAGLATTIAMGVSATIALSLVFFWKNSPIKVSLKSFWKFDLKILKDIFYIGLPAAGESFVIQIGLMVFSSIISSLGTISVAAHQIVLQINRLAFSISQAFQVSTTTLVGQSTGAGDYELAEKYVILNRRAARLTSMIAALIFIIFAEPLSMIFIKDPEVIKAARPLFYFIAGVQFVQSSRMSTVGALRGAGDTMYPLYATIFGIWTFRVGLTALLIKVLGFGVNAAWLSFFLDQSLRNLIVLKRFNTGKWKQIHQERAEQREANAMN